MNRETTNGVAALNVLCHSANWTRFVRHSMRVFFYTFEGMLIVWQNFGLTLELDRDD